MVTNRRIITLILSLISLNSFALSISIEKETPNGILQKAFTTQEKENLLIKNSNFFDKDSKEIGKFKVTNSSSIKSEIIELERLSKALDLIAKNVVGASSLQKPKHEETYLKINQHYVTSEHPLFKEVDENIANLFKKLKTSNVDVLGIKEEDGFLVKTITRGKKESKINFDVKEICQREAKFLRCTDEKYGTLFIK